MSSFVDPTEISPFHLRRRTHWHGISGIPYLNGSSSGKIQIAVAGRALGNAKRRKSTAKVKGCGSSGGTERSHGEGVGVVVAVLADALVFVVEVVVPDHHCAIQQHSV
jgi:hypothetical protein